MIITFSKNTLFEGEAFQLFKLLFIKGGPFFSWVNNTLINTFASCVTFHIFIL